MVTVNSEHPPHGIMALVLNGYETRYGMTVNGAYLRVVSVNTTSNNGVANATADCHVFYDQHSANVGGNAPIGITSHDFTFDLTGIPNFENIIRMAYLALKDMPEYADASDA